MPQRTPPKEVPYDLDAEESVIASLVLNPTLWDSVSKIVQATDFYREKHGWLFTAIGKVFKRDGVKAVNQITVCYQLSCDGLLEAVGGSAYLSSIIATLPTSVGCEWYAKIVAQTARARRAIRAGAQISAVAYADPANLDTTIAPILKELKPKKKGVEGL